MNINELKSSWKNFDSTEPQIHSQGEIKKIIKNGASIMVYKMNKKIFRGMAVTAFATILSAFGVVFFYVWYDPVQHPQIDRLFQNQIFILGFIIFLLLFLSSYFEFKLVNKKVDSENVKDYLQRTLRDLRRHHVLFSILILPLMFFLFLLELEHFITPDKSVSFGMVGIAVILTGLSYRLAKLYYRRSMKAYYDEMKTDLNELL